MDRIQEIDLRELSEYEGPERVFLTVYIAGEAGARSIERRFDALRRVLVEDGGHGDTDDVDGPEGAQGGAPERESGRAQSVPGSDTSDELEHFDRNLELVQEWLEAHPPGRGTSCVFACYALDLLRGYQLDLEMETEVHVGGAPFVRPLAELQDEYQTFAVVAADNEATRVFLVTASQQDLVRQIRGDVKSHTKKGGWSQKRYQRRRDNELQHYAGEVAEFLATLSKRKSFDRIVLVGSEETMVAIGDALDPELTERIVARDTLDLKEGDEALVAEAFEHYWAAERAEEQELWSRVRAEYKRSGGLAAAGAEDVLQAVKTGRADVVIVERDASVAGVRCSACENTSVGTPGICRFCGAMADVEIDLVDELSRQAERTGARVEYADHIAGLAGVGGVAALLRF